ncbi:MAG: SufE family protein [Parashewanella sp.]
MSSPSFDAFQFPFSNYADLTEQLSKANNWQDKYRQLMMLGKALPKIDEALKTHNAQIDGCESAAWLYHYQQGDIHYFLADSDARIVKGLIAILLALFNQKSTDDIQQVNIEACFKELGLLHQLSPSRTNGLMALAKRIKQYAE